MSAWELFALGCAIAVPLSVCMLALVGRLNDHRRAEGDEEEALGDIPRRPE